MSLTVTLPGPALSAAAAAQWNGLLSEYKFREFDDADGADTRQRPAKSGNRATLPWQTQPVQASNSVPFLVLRRLQACNSCRHAPCRIFDTRLRGANQGTYPANSTFGSPYIAAGAMRPIPIPTSTALPRVVPPNAQAYSLNFTVQPRTATVGSLTVWPAGTAQPNVSTLSFLNPAVVLAAAGIVPAGAGGAINATATQDVDLIVDINGYFVPPATGTLQFYTVPPCRVLDTRTPANGGSPILANSTFGSPLSPVPNKSVHSLFLPSPSGNCGAPASLRRTRSTWGWCRRVRSIFWLPIPPGDVSGRIHPELVRWHASRQCGHRALLRPAAQVTFYASNPTDFFVDINGYFAPPVPGGLNFYTVTPCRLVDTRNGNGGPDVQHRRDESFPAAGFLRNTEWDGGPGILAEHNGLPGRRRALLPHNLAHGSSAAFRVHTQWNQADAAYCECGAGSGGYRRRHQRVRNQPHGCDHRHRRVLRPVVVPWDRRGLSRVCCHAGSDAAEAACTFDFRNPGAA